MDNLKFLSRQFYRYVMNYTMYELDEKDLGRTAVVFSPHPDDETLGCGGTIIKKKRAGAGVKIFFMTNGEKSHRYLVPENKLKYIRTNEALAASRPLGVGENDVVFLEYEDGELSKNQDSAIPKVKEILQREQPDEIFIPYEKETHPDHFGTNRIVMSALQLYKRKAIIYEYPIYFWYHWPFISVPLKGILSALKQSLVSELILLRDFQCSVYIGDVLELKQAALNQYKSQMTRLIPNPRWQTFGDMANGEFLECFFQEHEIFRRHILHG